MKKLLISAMLILILLSFSACAPGPNEMENTEDPDGEIAGFWEGLWHGLIAPITFVISIFKQDVSLYEIYNNGGWYDLGFAIGASIITGGGGKGAGKVSSRRKD